MATDLEQLQTQRTALLAKIAAAVPRPDYNIDGQSVTYSTYIKSLYEQLDTLDSLIDRIQGPYELVTETF